MDLLTRPSSSCFLLLLLCPVFAVPRIQESRALHKLGRCSAHRSSKTTITSVYCVRACVGCARPVVIRGLAQESILTFYHMGPGPRTQVVRLGAITLCAEPSHRPCFTVGLRGPCYVSQTGLRDLLPLRPCWKLRCAPSSWPRAPPTSDLST